MTDYAAFAADVRRELERLRASLRPEDHACPCEPVGQKQIADRLGLQRKSVNMAALRDTLPKPIGQVGNYPAYCWPHQIVPWAEWTNRLLGNIAKNAGGQRRA